MPAIRSGFGSDFVLKNEKIGIGSTTPTSVFDVGGAIRGDFAITGVATLTSYGGFVAQNQHINKASSIGFATVGLNTAGAAIGVGATHVANQYYETETGFTDLGGVHHGDDQKFNTLSEDLIIDDGQILNITSIDMVGFTTIGEYDPHSHESYVCAGSLEEVSVTDHFSVPSGGINDRKDNPIEGTVRFNDDLNTLEFFNGNEWKQFTYNQGQSGRAIYGGTSNNPYYQVLHYVNIHTTGNSIDFGSLLIQRYATTGSCSSNTRALVAGGWISPTSTDTIEYFTMASNAQAIDFGNLAQAEYAMLSCSSSTRGLFTGSYQAPSNTAQIDYVEIGTTGNALDFGDMSGVTRYGGCGLSSPTRGIFAGGRAKGTVGPYSTNAGTHEIDFVSIAAKGNSTDFGDMTFNGGYCGGISNTTRGIIGGARQPATVNNIDMITIASTGNAVHFGDLTVARAGSQTGSTQTRGVFIGGSPTADTRKTIDYITISSSGNAIDFGESGFEVDIGASVSDSHGGLGGF